MEDFIPFLSWLWSLAWRLGLVVLVLLILIPIIGSIRRDRLYKQHFPHPVEILTVMSTERWDSMPRIRQLLDAKAKANIFALRQGLQVFYEPPTPPAFHLDFVWLLEQGLLEQRVAVYEESTGRLMPEDFTPFLYDEQNHLVIVLLGYRMVPEYKKTGKGGGKRSKHESSTEEKIPQGVAVA